MKRVYMFLSCCIGESVDVRGVYDDLDQAISEHQSMKLSEHLVACNLGYPMELRYLSDYSELNAKQIAKEREYLEKENDNG